MTLATILGIVLSLAATPVGAMRRAAIFPQEDPKPAGQQTAPGPSGQESSPSGTQAAPEQTPPVTTPDAGAPPTQIETPAQAPTQGAPAAPATTEKPKPKTQTAKTRKPRTRKRPAKPTPDPNAPAKKVVVSNGSTSDPVVQISSGKQSASQQVGNTKSLLDATNSNLKKIAGRQLAPAQQVMVKQIHAYLEQSKAASDIGDLQGAHNLAFKAHLLSEELLKQ